MDVIAHLRLYFLLSILLGVTALPCLLPAEVKSKADEEAGALLFREKGCTFCHGSDGAGTPKGPSLTNIRTDKAWPPEKITKQILDGGKKMPPFRESLDDSEIAQLVAYLRARVKPAPSEVQKAPSN